MGVHTINFIKLNQPPPNETARCRCGWVPKNPVLTRQMVEDNIAAHMYQIERARNSARRTQPRLENEADHYRAMSENPNVEPRDREQWKRLADEVDQRLGRNAPKTEQIELFKMEK